MISFTTLSILFHHVSSLSKIAAPGCHFLSAWYGTGMVKVPHDSSYPWEQKAIFHLPTSRSQVNNFIFTIDHGMCLPTRLLKRQPFNCNQLVLAMMDAVDSSEAAVGNVSSWRSFKIDMKHCRKMFKYCSSTIYILYIYIVVECSGTWQWTFPVPVGPGGFHIGNPHWLDQSEIFRRPNLGIQKWPSHVVVSSEMPWIAERNHNSFSLVFCLVSYFRGEKSRCVDVLHCFTVVRFQPIVSAQHNSIRMLGECWRLDPVSTQYTGCP